MMFAEGMSQSERERKLHPAAPAWGEKRRCDRDQGEDDAWK